jgi:hypothetical protein
MDPAVISSPEHVQEVAGAGHGSAAMRRFLRAVGEDCVPLRNLSGRSGARLRKAYGAAGPRPTKQSTPVNVCII